jgi:hypothetical protein
MWWRKAGEGTRLTWHQDDLARGRTCGDTGILLLRFLFPSRNLIYTSYSIAWPGDARMPWAALGRQDREPVRKGSRGHGGCSQKKMPGEDALPRSSWRVTKENEVAVEMNVGGTKRVAEAVPG